MDINDVKRRVEDDFENIKKRLEQNGDNLEGIFEKQPDFVLRDIRDILGKIKTIKALSSGGSSGTIRFKISEEIINEFIFEQEESPLAVFFKNLFTQKRKLGPQASNRHETKTKLEEL